MMTSDYKNRAAATKTAGESPNADKSLIELLQLVARAARQLHTYPATSPLSIEAIEACHRAFLAFEGAKPLALRITPHDLIVNDRRVGGGTIIELELARPLHRAHVVSIEVDHTASVRDWAQFCTALIGCHRPSKSKTTFAEVLLEAGVAAIIVRMAPRPEVLELGAPPTPVQGLVERERERQSARSSGGPVQYFYPPDKGWVRLDPAVRYDSVSLLDLAVLINDPTELAAVLMRLTDDDSEGVPPSAALEQKYSDVVTLIGGLDPRLARILFGKLARAVLDLDADRRKALLRRSILPGLLDGRVDSQAVLTEFPDVELADALCLLLDLETAAPELLTAAVDRLNLAPERRTTVAPLIEARLRAGAHGAAGSERADAGLNHYAGRLIQIDAAAGKSFAEFSSFDLSMNEQTAGTLTAVCQTIASTDGAQARLSCLAGLIRLEPNPALVSGYVDRALAGCTTLARGAKWADLAVWLAQFNDLTTLLRPTRPEVADLVGSLPTKLCTRDLVVQLSEVAGSGDDGLVVADAIVAAVKRALVPAWLEALSTPATRAKVATLTPILSSHARELAPAVAKRLQHCTSEAAFTAVGLLGQAGVGYERVIAEQLPKGDERAGREALRALARIGTHKAADLVVDQLENGPGWAPAAAEEALWRLPAALALAKARELLGRRGFVTRHPQLAVRLLGRTAQTRDEALGQLLERLAPLRYHFWNPAVVRVGAKARELMQ